MPCAKEGHESTHVWPERGPLTIERCEMLCGYCTGADAKHIWKFAWFLRRHVQSVHIDSGEFGAVKLAPGWTRAQQGNTRSQSKKKAARRVRKSAARVSPSSTSGNSPSVKQQPLPSSSGSSNIELMQALGDMNQRTSNSPETGHVTGSHFDGNGSYDPNVAFGPNSGFDANGDFNGGNVFHQPGFGLGLGLTGSMDPFTDVANGGYMHNGGGLNFVPAGHHGHSRSHSYASTGSSFSSILPNVSPFDQPDLEHAALQDGFDDYEDAWAQVETPLNTTLIDELLNNHLHGTPASFNIPAPTANMQADLSSDSSSEYSPQSEIMSQSHMMQYPNSNTAENIPPVYQPSAVMVPPVVDSTSS